MSTKEVKILITARDNATAKIKKVAGAIGVAFAARTAWQGIKQLTDYGDDIGKQAKRIGVTTDAWQKLSFAARRTGSDQSELETGLRRMSSTIYDAGRGVKESVEALDKLGLKYDDLANKRPDEQFALLGDALNKVSDATTKSALAQDVFGRSGTKLIPMLSEYRDLAKELQQKGGIISDKNIKAAEQFKDSMENIKSAAMAFVSNTGLLQYLNNIATALDKVSSKLAPLSKNFGTAIGSYFNSTNFIARANAQIKRESAADMSDMDVVDEPDFIRKARAEREKWADISAFGQGLNMMNEQMELRNRWWDAMTITDADRAMPQIIIGDEFEQNFSRSLSDIFETLAAEQGKEIVGPPATALPKDDPADANVFRFLSGLSSTVRPAEQTAKNTSTTAQATQQTVTILNGLLEINKKMLQNPLSVLQF